MISEIIVDFIKKKINQVSFMATARVMCRGTIPVLQITTPTRKCMQDVTLQLLHHQEKISMVDHRLRGMSVFPASVQKEVLQELTLS